MANWRVDVTVSFEITSDEIEDFGDFRSMRPGARNDLLVERVFLDTYGREHLDRLLDFDLLRRATPEFRSVDRRNPDGSVVRNPDGTAVVDLIEAKSPVFWRTNGTTIKSGTDGELVRPSEFRSVAVTLANADVGRVIRIRGGQTPLASRGHYLIIGRNGPNSVTVDGVLPTAATGLNFDIDERAEILATLLSRP